MVVLPDHLLTHDKHKFAAEDIVAAIGHLAMAVATRASAMVPMTRPVAEAAAAAAAAPWSPGGGFSASKD